MKITKTMLAYAVVLGVVAGHYGTIQLQHAIAEYRARVVAEAMQTLTPTALLSDYDRQTLALVNTTRDRMAAMQLPRGTKTVASLIEGVR